MTAITWESEESRLKEPWKSSLSAFAQYERFEPEILALRSPVSPMNVTLLKGLVAMVPTGALVDGGLGAPEQKLVQDQVAFGCRRRIFSLDGPSANSSGG